MTDIPMHMPDMGEYQLTAFQCFEDGRFWSVWDTRPHLYSPCFTDELYLDWEVEHPDTASMAFDDYRLDELREGDFVAIEGTQQDEIHDALFHLADMNGGGFAAKAISPLGCQAVAYFRIRPLLKGAMREILEVAWYDFTGVPIERSVRLYGENGAPEYAALPVNSSPHGSSND